MPVVADNSDDDYDDYEFIIKNENTQTSSRKATDRWSYEYKERVEAHTIYVPPKLLQPH